MTRFSDAWNGPSENPPPRVGFLGRVAFVKMSSPSTFSVSKRPGAGTNLVAPRGLGKRPAGGTFQETFRIPKRRLQIHNQPIRRLLLITIAEIGMEYHGHHPPSAPAL